jgi:hypothetical protein
MGEVIGRLLCLIGVHGPNWFGNESGHRSGRLGGFVRECSVCGERWYGREVETRTLRTLGDWKTRKQLVAEGVWPEESGNG